MSNPYEQPSVAPYPPQYGAPGYPPPGGFMPPQPPKTNGLGVAALVLGIIGSVLFWIPFLGALLGLIGLPLGIVGWKGAVPKNKTKRIAIAGTVLAALALVLGGATTALELTAVKKVGDCITQFNQDHDRVKYDNCVQLKVNG